MDFGGRPRPQVALGIATRKCEDKPLGRGAPEGAGGRRSLTAGFCLRLDPGDYPQAGPAACDARVGVRLALVNGHRGLHRRGLVGLPAARLRRPPSRAGSTTPDRSRLALAHGDASWPEVGTAGSRSARREISTAVTLLGLGAWQTPPRWTQGSRCWSASHPRATKTHQLDQVA